METHNGHGSPPLPERLKTIQVESLKPLSISEAYLMLLPSPPLGLHPLLLLESLGGSGLAQTLTLGSLVSLELKL